MARRHRFFSSERVQGYSDAVYAIVITILIIPLSDGVHHYDTTKTLFENIAEEYMACIIYVLAFIFICSDWEEHVWLFESIENVGDAVILANLLTLLPVTFLPFAFSLLTVWIDEPFAIILFCTCGFFIIGLELFIVLMAYRRPQKFIKEKLADGMTPNAMKKLLIFKCVVKLVLVIISGLTSLFSIYTSYAFLCLLMLHDWISGLIVGIYHHCKDGEMGYEHRHFIRYTFHHLFTTRFAKMRYTVFADGVFSIVATLIILDLSSTGVPDEATRNAHGALRHTLAHEKHMFLSFVGSFMTVGLLWLNHHTVFHFIHSVSRLMSTLNKCSLLFVGMLPYCFKLIATYAEGETDRQENYVVQIYCGVTFFAAMFQLLMYLAAKAQSDRHLHDSHKGMINKFILAKLCIYPVLTFLIFCICFMPTAVNADAINVVLAIVPLLFYIMFKVTVEIIHHKTVVSDIGEDGTEIKNEPDKKEENANKDEMGVENNSATKVENNDEINNDTHL